MSKFGVLHNRSRTHVRVYAEKFPEEPFDVISGFVIHLDQLSFAAFVAVVFVPIYPVADLQRFNGEEMVFAKQFPEKLIDAGHRSVFGLMKSQ